MTTVALIKLYDAKPEAMAEDISDDDLDHEGKADGDDVRTYVYNLKYVYSN